MNPALRIFLGVAGGVVTVALIAVISVLGVARDLPSDLAALSSWQSPAESTVLDSDHRTRATLRIVEGGSWPGEAPEDLVEAFFAAAPPSFYEPLSRRATSLGPALRRAVSGEAPPASPISVELARLLLSEEPPGPARRVREDLVATWLDARVPLPVRATAWLDRAPLCLGRRGLAHAAETCLGKPLSRLEPADHVAIAVAATWRLDLAGDPDQIRARRAQVLDELVARGRLLSAEASALSQAAIPAPRPAGAQAWVELVTLAVRHQLGRGNEPRGARIETDLDWSVQEGLAAALPSRPFMVMSPADGAVVAVQGDVLGRSDGGSASVSDVVAWAASAVAATTTGGRLPIRPITTRAPRWYRQVVLTGDDQREEEIVAFAAATDPLSGLGRHQLLRLPPAELFGVAALSDLPLTGSMRRATVAGVELLVHEALVAGWSAGAAAPPAVADVVGRLAGGVAFSRPERYAWTRSIGSQAQ